MKTFRCDFCGHPLFFENVQCLHCDSPLAFLPDRLALCAIQPAGPEADGLWRRRPARGTNEGRTYRMCRNHTQHQSCNFAVTSSDPNPLCVSCRLTHVLPDLSIPNNQEHWYRIEVAKRRLFYTLARLRLVSAEPAAGQQDGPAFKFLADLPGQTVLTGHCEGVITVNVAEADDAERIRRRIALHEPYRTLLGHLRHESGHFYWDRLVLQGGPLDAFRERFGDERGDYRQALATYYAAGAPEGWQAKHVSAYASSHPWEDWAETWAHYLHMVDLLETAASYSTRLMVPGDGECDAEGVSNPFEGAPASFDQLVEQWVPLTLLLNSLNRSLGQEDAYPFALRAQALDKLRFVHDIIQTRQQPAAPSGAASRQAHAASAPA